MREGRELLDEWLFKVKLSGLIPEGAEILEIGTGHCLEHYMMFHDAYGFQPTDVVIYDGVPNMRFLDVHDFTCSDLIDEQDAWKAMLLSQVLEHVLLPEMALRQCYDHLEPDGIIIVTLPFWYRIHRSGDPDDHETTELQMLDLWRITDDCLRLLLTRAGFGRIYVERLYHHENPHEKFTPPFIVGWAQKVPYNNENCLPEIVHNWDFELPDNWRMIQADLEVRFKRRMQRGEI
jgi:SAM-dependent methyltransferase